MANVVMYTANPCPYCLFAKRLLQERNIAYVEHDLTGDFEGRKNLINKTGMRTVPQIFFGEHHVGGFDELAALDRSGQLMELLEANT